MSRKMEQEPRIVVTQRVDAKLSREEVEHALRCWISHGGAAAESPKPKNFSAIVVAFDTGEGGGFYGVTLTYEPESAVISDQTKGPTS